MTTETTVRRVLVPEDRRLAVTAERFGVWFPMRLEPVVFSFAERLSKDSNEGHGGSGRQPTAGSTCLRPGRVCRHLQCPILLAAGLHVRASRGLGNSEGQCTNYINRIQIYVFPTIQLIQDAKYHRYKQLNPIN